MKSAHLPLVVTAPYAAALREKTLLLASKAKLLSSSGDKAASSSVEQQSSSTAGSMDVVPQTQAQTEDLMSSIVDSSGTMNEQESPQLWVIQRKVRAALVKQQLSSPQSGGSASSQVISNTNIHPPVSLGPTNYVSDLLAYRNFYRTRKQMRRDVKAWEKEDRRRRLELEDRRKKKALEYHKALLSHREDFFRFHKNKKFGTWCAYSIVLWLCRLWFHGFHVLGGFAIHTQSAARRPGL